MKQRQEEQLLMTSQSWKRVTMWGTKEKSPIYLSQFWKNRQFVGTKL